MAERGEPGESRRLRLELRLLADVGIVGLPNAGKSTLLAALTRARPKIAAYPFTTLEPNLGVLEREGSPPLVLADIPGLIEGAHLGAGLGTRFLRHVQRTRALVHLLDGSSPDPLADFSQVNAELALFDPGLIDKAQVVAVNKSDLPEVQRSWGSTRTRLEAQGLRPLLISALERTGLDDLIHEIYAALARPPVTPKAEETEIPVYRLAPDPGDFEVQREPDGAWRVVGKAVERSAEMTYWEYDEAVRRFQRLLSRLGVERALREAGAASGDTVRIGEYELEWQD
jgi:GTP-binding protein